MYVQYGCGHCAPDGWLNFDSSPTLRFERIPIVGRLYTKNATRFPDAVRYGDIVRGLSLPDNSCRGLYASHVLEHLPRDDIETALRETFRLLAPGGIFRLVVPDLEAAAREYMHDLETGNPNAADRFVGDNTLLGVRSRSKTILRIIYEGLATHHHWMWDYISLAHLLKTHGFTDIRRAAFNDSGDPAFRAVEDLARFQGQLAIEARKPPSR